MFFLALHTSTAAFIPRIDYTYSVGTKIKKTLLEPSHVELNYFCISHFLITILNYQDSVKIQPSG